MAARSATGSTTSSAEPLGAVRRFPIRIGRRSRPLLRLFGVRGDNAYVDLADDVDVRFGFFRVRTPVTNLSFAFTTTFVRSSVLKPVTLT